MNPKTQFSKAAETSTYSKLKKIPRAIKRLTGISIEKFEDILKHVTPKFKIAEEKRLFKTKRKRAFGGGRKPDLDLDDRLLVLLMYYHLFVTHEFLGALFNKHNSNIGRSNAYIKPMLENIHGLPERKIRLAETTYNEEQLLELFYSLNEAEKNVEVYTGADDILTRSISSQRGNKLANLSEVFEKENEPLQIKVLEITKINQP